MESKSEYIPVLVWNDLSQYIANFMQSATTNLLLSQGKALDILCVCVSQASWFMEAWTPLLSVC